MLDRLLNRNYPTKVSRVKLFRLGLEYTLKIRRQNYLQSHFRLNYVRVHLNSPYRGEISPAVPNLVNRNFSAAAPNQKWLTDITEFQIPAGKIYLSPMIDCFDGLVISWTMSTRPDAELVNTMLDEVITTLLNNERPTVHSDRSAHYRWPGRLSRIENAKLIRSMSRKGCTPDNAACEGFFGRLKTAYFYPRDWRATTAEQFMQAVDSYIRWYNEKRIKVSLGALSPLEYRESLGLAA